MSVADVSTIAAQVRGGTLSARAAVEQSLARIAASDAVVNAFTAQLAERALKRANMIDVHPQREKMSLAGVPFAVKNLFDIAGLPTLAGSKIERDAAPAKRDALLVRRLEARGAVLVGALNMDEYAYGFSTENTHYGPTRNPHDPARISGGSSGGSAAAVAAGQVPLSLGSDTNGSIRVPASLCGVFGLKPSLGRIPIKPPYAGRVAGPMTRTVRDAALMMRVLSRPDWRDSMSLPWQDIPWQQLDPRGQRLCGCPPPRHLVAQQGRQLAGAAEAADGGQAFSPPVYLCASTSPASLSLSAPIISASLPLLRTK